MHSRIAILLTFLTILAGIICLNIINFPLSGQFLYTKDMTDETVKVSVMRYELLSRYDNTTRYSGTFQFSTLEIRVHGKVFSEEIRKWRDPIFK